MFQELVQSAYIILTAVKVGFKMDPEAISLATDHSMITIPLYEIIRKELIQLGKELISTERSTPNANVPIDKLKVFLGIDVHMEKRFGPCPDIDEGSCDFTYESLSSLSRHELKGLKDMIDRLQILLSSSMFYEDFNVAFTELSKLSYRTFLDRYSDFSISRFAIPRGRILLAMYKSTIDWRFFKSKDDYYKFIKFVFVWLFETKNTISKILKPSHKPESDTRFYLNSNHHFIDYLKDVSREFSILLIRYQALRAMAQSLYPVDLRSFCDNLYLVTIKDQHHLTLLKANQNFGEYYRLRTVFFELLLGGVWKFKKNGWVIPATEATIFGDVNVRAMDVSIKDLSNFGFQSTPNRQEVSYWKFHFRIVGPESKRQIQDKKKFIAYLEETQTKWRNIRDRRRNQGTLPKRKTITEPLNATILCFPISTLYAIDSYPLTQKDIFLNDDDYEVCSNIVEKIYHHCMNSMQNIRDICADDLLKFRDRFFLVSG